MRGSRIAIIGAPMDLGAGRRGVDMGPSAVRVANLNERVASLGYKVEDLGNIHVVQAESVESGTPSARYLHEIAATCTRLANMVKTAADQGEFPIVLGGDIHSFWANDLKRDFNDPKSVTVATELVCTSIASRGPPYELYARCLPDNPHVRFFESRYRGYACADLTQDDMTTRFRVVSDVTKPDATIATLKTFIVEHGIPGANAS